MNALLVPRAAIFALATCALMPMGCRNLSRFSTTSGHYEGTVVSGTFVRANIDDGTRMCLTIDTDQLQTAPGAISTSDGRFSATALRQIPQVWHDPLSSLSFGEGRERNLIYMAAASSDAGAGGDVTVIISLMESGDVEVRLLRGGASASPAAAATNIFGVFILHQTGGNCPF
ncbi:hypothetical protein [Pendulispora albinea]|uniref:Uncharacterized protein n=1 Tax=Pendulispora albinea TaxID=2741071 RepID=A0ABZ2LYD3_9BACT